MHLARIIIDGEGDHGLAACRDGAQPGGDLVPSAALARQISEAGDGDLDFVQPACGGLRTGIVGQPARDGVKVIRDRRMEPDAIAYVSRAACSRARAAANALSEVT